ncbi:MAG: hypothetical protein DMD47_00800 [Gemmatimonadetes bacterium]|nr:MAG: hypothetical protein DMD47_00800 [Gemmatimonadota bacterium]
MNAVLDLVKVVYDPGAVFERLREKPSFWRPFIAICVVQLVLGVLQLPYTKAAMAAQFAQMPARAGGGAPDPSKFATIGLLFVPIGLLLLFLISAALLWVLVSVFAGDAKFATLLSVATYVGITFVLLSVAGLATLMLKGVQGITSPADLQPALGLDLLVPEAGRFTTALLKAFNPFSIWGVILTAIGIQTTHRTSKGTAYTVAAVAFVIGTLIGAGFAMLGPGAKS